MSQFVEGEQSLCCGVKTSVLQSKPIHQVQLSSKVYDIDCQKALALAKEKNSYYKGGDVTIVPIEVVGKVHETQY
jgi:hypothetical protein